MRQRRVTALMTGDKKREVMEEAYIYNEEGEQQEIMTCEESFTKKWTDNIYQKLKKADFTFWYGSNDQQGIKDQMVEELERGNPDIMENPFIEEKEFVDVINSMKNIEVAKLWDKNYRYKK